MGDVRRRLTGLILASRSPQRRAILEQLGIAFEVIPSDVHELRDGDAAEVVTENALRKARAVRDQCGNSDDNELVLGVDTEVFLNGRVFGKASTETEARDYLTTLSGRTHQVFSGIALLDNNQERTAVATTDVTFRTLTETTITWYLATNEWQDRAGAYAIQGYGAALVERIDGDFWNVVGLPVATLLDLEPSLIG